MTTLTALAPAGLQVEPDAASVAERVAEALLQALREEMRMRGIVTTATTIATTTTNNRNNNSMMDERAQLINEDNVLPQTRIPSVSFVPSQTMALGEDI